MFGHRSLIVILLLFVCGASAAGDDDEEGSLQNRKLKKTKQALEFFEVHFDRILQKGFANKTYGLLYREAINMNDEEKGINENSDRDILEEYKKTVMYFYSSSPAATSVDRILANYHVTHIATWFKLNFQTCSSFYDKNVEKEEIRNNCEKLATIFETFTSITPEVQAYRYDKFRKKSPENVKITEGLKSTEADIVSERLKDAIEVDKVADPDISMCEHFEDEKKRYCELWMGKLIAQPKSFKLNHILFDVYNGLKKDSYNVFDHDSYGSDFDGSIALWNQTPKLLEKKEVQPENKERKEKEKITSHAVNILFEIIEFKLRPPQTEVPETS